MSPAPNSSPLLDPSNEEPRRSGFAPRVVPLLLTFVFVAIALRLIAGPEAPNAFATLGYMLLLVPSFLSATMLGLFLTQRFAAKELFTSALLHLATAAAMGWGAFSLLTLLLGTVGLLSPGFALLPVAAGLVLGILPTRDFLKKHPPGRFLFTQAHRGEWLLLLTAIPIAMLLLAATFPPGTLWQSEARGYDVMEYHLQLPREYAENNATTPLRHNVYSYFPSNIEMLYLHLQQVSSLAVGDPSHLWGTYPAQFLHVSFMLLTALALGSMPLLRAPLTPTGRTAAVLVFLGTPWTIVTGSLAYNEGGMLLYGTLALGFALAPVASFSKSRGVLIGLLLGLAMGCKLTAGLYFALPVGVILLARAIRARAALVTLAVAVVGAAVTYAPWAVRAGAASGGNPLFPLATSVFGRGHWSPQQAEAFDRGHAPREADRPWVNRLRALVGASVLDAQWSPSLRSIDRWSENAPSIDSVWARVGLLWWLLPAGVAMAFIHKDARGPAFFLLAILLVQVAGWLLLTHLQPRFLLPTVIPLSLLLALSIQGNPARREFLPVAGLRVFVATVVALHAACAAFLLLPEHRILGGLIPRKNNAPPVPIGQLFERQYSVATAAALTTRPGLTEAPPPEPLLLVGDATAWQYTSPVKYATVFDAQPLGEALRSSDPSAYLRERGIRYVLIQWPEVERLRRSYGFDDAITPECVATLKKAGLREVLLNGPGITLLRVPEGR